jgi:uncharacterized protein
VKAGEHTSNRQGGALIRPLISIYSKVLSPLLHAASGVTGACRFQPTCSEYAKLAIQRHGIVRGTLLAARRLSKCHPFHAPGFDPVPGTWPASSKPSEPPSMQSCQPPVTIEETGFSAASPATSRRLAVTLPQDRR